MVDANRSSIIRAGNTLTPRFLVGLRFDIKGSANFTNNNEVIYTAGGLIVIHDFEKKIQQFLPFSACYTPDIIAINNARNLLAISEYNQLEDK